MLTDMYQISGKEGVINLKAINSLKLMEIHFVLDALIFGLG